MRQSSPPLPPAPWVWRSARSLGTTRRASSLDESLYPSIAYTGYTKVTSRYTEHNPLQAASRIKVGENSGEAKLKCECGVTRAAAIRALLSHSGAGVCGTVRDRHPALSIDLIKANSASDDSVAGAVAPSVGGEGPTSCPSCLSYPSCSSSCQPGDAPFVSYLCYRNNTYEPLGRSLPPMVRSSMSICSRS